MPRLGSGQDLARELNVTRQAVHKAEKAGRISRTAGGKFDLDAAAIQYRLHTNPEQQRRALAQQGQGATTAIITPLGMDDWRIREQRANAERAEIELAKLKGTLVNKADLLAEMRRIAYAIGSAMDQISDRIAAECGENDTQRRKLRQVAQRELDRVRTEVVALLEHDPQ